MVPRILLEALNVWDGNCMSYVAVWYTLTASIMTFGKVGYVG